MNMKAISILSIVIMALLFLSACSQPKINVGKKGSKYSVKVVGIVDGDTFDGIFELNGKTLQKRYRLACIDTPEKGQPFFKNAKQKLSDLIFGQYVTVKVEQKDRYKREVVWVINEKEQDVQAEMLKSGMAWHFKRYNQDSYYSNLEEVAHQNHLGLWQDENPVAPWLWRKR